MWNNRRLTGPDASIDNDIHSSDEEDDDQANSEGNSRGACGRISTADGRIISDPQVLEEIERLEEARREEARQRAERTEERERSDAYELPLTSILRSLNIVPRGVRPTKAHLIRLYTDYLEKRLGTWRMLFPLHGLRKNMVQSLLFFLVDNREMMHALSSTSSSSLLFSDQGTSSSPSSTTISSPSFLSCPQCLVLGAICNLCDGSVARWQDSSSSSSSSSSFSSSSSSSSLCISFPTGGGSQCRPNLISPICPYCNQMVQGDLMVYQVHILNCLESSF